MKIEVFLADCKLCEKFLGIINSVFPADSIDVKRASECKDGLCCTRASQIGIKAVPSLVIDGKIVLTGIPDEKEIEDLKSLAH